MSEMIERVARAMFVKAWGEPADWAGEADEMPHFRESARTAIEAMREPTDAMLLASEFLATGASRTDVIEDYRAMIDAALAHPERPA